MNWQKCISMLEREMPFSTGERHQHAGFASNGYFLASKAIFTAIPASTVAISQR